MTSWKRVVTLALLGIRAAKAQNCTFDSITPSRDLVWCACEGRFLCAKLDVPLDYQQPDLGRAAIALVKLPAASESPDGQYRGMILINPGGPGASGVELALYNGSVVQAVAGSNYDVVGFDPRGVGITEPRPNCSAGILLPRDEALSRRDAPRFVDRYYQDFIDFGKELGERCQAQAGANTEAGPHMTSAVTARDMVSVVDAFAVTPDGERAALNSSLLNYYGISYGTFLGQTFASMFPDRVGHLAIDGQVSPEGFQSNFTSNSVNHIDGVFGAFFVYCHAAGSACTFYSGNTAMDIFKRWNASFVQLEARKAEDEGWSNATEIASALETLKYVILDAAVGSVGGFIRAADAFVDLENALASGSLSTWTENTNLVFNFKGIKGYASGNPEQSLGVICSDQSNVLYGKSLEDIQPLILDLQDQSIVGDIWTTAMLGCLGWPIKSDDVFRGPYGGNTSHPLLFISNTFDPTTPIDNAIASIPNYANARSLTVDNMGHSVAASGANFCAYGAIRSYFQDTMCGKKHYCPVERGPFGVLLNGTIQQNLEAAGLSNLRSLY
ncbi:Tripeptidyl aminopeptidase [Colletotrichum tanaceti]|uniref:Tripeptidyl aminopeptidase n=1 Tax=Colletotrichum tanaceti TaxID=1306861 RepID=A0A4V6DHB3_9PEZI|nr:Tripeptidyl aminopeptidase [Colletotrichum tanaceti]KAJ0168249.1 Tripeptidyl aminopeptidase [Colletotrichum tanaceti]TKW55916.1 Tripeptidyl aminopeptidase [Colletotrichum tanaceti]